MRLGTSIEHHPIIDSTNRRALEWARHGAPEGALVAADHQTRGRGRRGRTWIDEPGSSLLASVVLRPSGPAERLGLLPLAAGLAVAEGLEMAVPGLRPRLKWPNDVLLEEKKVSGILAESHLTGQDVTLVIGFGLNLTQRAFSDELSEHATSVMIASGMEVDRDVVLQAILERLAAWYAQWRAGGFDEIVAAFSNRMDLLGEIVTVRPPGGPPVRGRALRLDQEGALVLDMPAGERRFLAGEVSLDYVPTADPDRP